MDKDISRSSIIMKIKVVLREYFEVDYAMLDNFTQMPLTEHPFMLNAIQLYELLMLMEENFKKYFSSDDIRENGFSTIEDIICLIQKDILGSKD